MCDLLSNTTCSSATAGECVETCSTGNNFALAFFFGGNILIGVGAAPLFTVGTSYLDDIVSPKYVSIYLGAFYAFAIIGPAIGYGLGGLFLSIYVDPWIEPSIDESNPAWVGAWWLCFVVSGVLSWLLAIPFLMFPKWLPNSAAVKEERVKEMAQKYVGKDSGLEEVDLALKVRSFPQHLKQVLKTPSWIFITIAICFSTVVVSGVASFAPKYLESQFSLTASRASLIAGGVGEFKPSYRVEPLMVNPTECASPLPPPPPPPRVGMVNLSKQATA
jgi:organic anion transporter 4A